jgi:hypothetical protein
LRLDSRGIHRIGTRAKVEFSNGVVVAGDHLATGAGDGSLIAGDVGRRPLELLFELTTPCLIESRMARP